MRNPYAPPKAHIFLPRRRKVDHRKSYFLRYVLTAVLLQCLMLLCYVMLNLLLS